jgi:hypothetical protein
VAEKARVIVEILSREIEQAQPTFSVYRQPGTTNIVPEINMLGGFEYGPNIQKSDRSDIQPRTNFLHNLFFYNNHTNAWQGIGYRVVNVTNGVGVLLRYETNQFGYRPLQNILSTAFGKEIRTNSTFHHIADGVVHLTFIPYDAQGYRLGFDTTNRNPGTYRIYRGDSTGTKISFPNDVALLPQANLYMSEGYPKPRAETLQYATAFSFKSNALPAFIEMEFGILEPETLSQYYMMRQDQNPNATNFLSRQIAKVHLFRQRIPIRTAAQ